MKSKTYQLVSGILAIILFIIEMILKENYQHALFFDSLKLLQGISLGIYTFVSWYVLAFVSTKKIPKLLSRLNAACAFLAVLLVKYEFLSTFYLVIEIACLNIILIYIARRVTVQETYQETNYVG